MVNRSTPDIVSVNVSFAIVTPSLNQARFIERTVRSVVEQEGVELEYVVCDGGSTDDTMDVLSPYAHRLKLISEPDNGQANAVNKGIRMTSGHIIGWLNSDDLYYPGALKRVAEQFRSRPDVDVVYGDARLIDVNDVVTGSYYTEPWDQRRLVERCILCQPAVFFRRRAVEQHGLLDERLHFCMDYEYWLRLADGGASFAYTPEVLAGSRQYPETKTLRDRVALHRELNAMLKARLGRVPESWLINQAHTLAELRHARAHRAGDGYAVEVAMCAIQLSLRWNGSISRHLVTELWSPVLAGAGRRLRGHA